MGAERDGRWQKKRPRDSSLGRRWVWEWPARPRRPVRVGEQQKGQGPAVLSFPVFCVLSVVGLPGRQERAAAAGQEPPGAGGGGLV